MGRQARLANKPSQYPEIEAVGEAGSEEEALTGWKVMPIDGEASPNLEGDRPPVPESALDDLPPKNQSSCDVGLEIKKPPCALFC